MMEFQDLPERVIRRIFHNLDSRARNNARLVCTEWNKLISRSCLRMKHFELNNYSWDIFKECSYLPFKKISVGCFDEQKPILGVPDLFVKELVFTFGELSYRNLLSVLKISQNHVKSLTLVVNLHRDKWLGLIMWKGIMSFQQLRKLIIFDEIIDRGDADCICQFEREQECDLDCIVCLSIPNACTMNSQNLDTHTDFMKNLGLLKIPSIQTFKWTVDYRNRQLQHEVFRLKPFCKEFFNFYELHQNTMKRAEIHLWSGHLQQTVIKAGPRQETVKPMYDCNYSGFTHNEVHIQEEPRPFKVDVKDVASDFKMSMGMFKGRSCEVYNGNHSMMPNYHSGGVWEPDITASAFKNEFLPDGISDEALEDLYWPAAQLAYEYPASLNVEPDIIPYSSFFNPRAAEFVSNCF